MKQQDLKSLLYESIENIDDDDFLMAVKEIMDRKYSPSSEPKLSEKQIDRIEESKKQIQSGQFLSNEQADSLVDKWLKRIKWSPMIQLYNNPQTGSFPKCLPNVTPFKFEYLLNCGFNQGKT